MSTGNFVTGDAVTYEAAGDLSSCQYAVVYHNSSNQVNLLTVATSTGAIPLGSLYNKPSAAGMGASVRLFNARGRVKVQAGASVSIGDRLTVTTSGQAIAVRSLGIEYQIGEAESAAAAAGQIISMRPFDPKVQSY